MATGFSSRASGESTRDIAREISRRFVSVLILLLRQGPLRLHIRAGPGRGRVAQPPLRRRPPALLMNFMVKVGAAVGFRFKTGHSNCLLIDRLDCLRWFLACPIRVSGVARALLLDVATSSVPSQAALGVLACGRRLHHLVRRAAWSRGGPSRRGQLRGEGLFQSQTGGP